MHIYGYIVFFVIGLSLAYFGTKQYILTYRILSVGVVTDAEVIEFVTVNDSDGNTYAPVFEYSDRLGAKKKYKSEVSYAKPSIQIGDKIEIVYHPQRVNEIKVLSFWGLYGWVVFFFSFASPFLLTGGGFLLYRYA